MLPWSSGLSGCTSTARSREGLPRAPCAPWTGRFRLLTVSSHHIPNRHTGFSLCMAKNHTTDYRTKASPGLRRSPAIAHVPHRSETQTLRQPCAWLNWSLSWWPKNGGTRNISYNQKLQMWLEMTQKCWCNKGFFLSSSPGFLPQTLLKTLPFWLSEEECNAYTTTGVLLGKKWPTTFYYRYW